MHLLCTVTGSPGAACIGLISDRARPSLLAAASRTNRRVRLGVPGEALLGHSPKPANDVLRGYRPICQEGSRRVNVSSISGVTTGLQNISRALLLLLAAGASAPFTAAQRDVRAAEAYLACVLRYHAGEHAAVAGEVSTWSPGNLRLALRGLPEALVGVTENRRISKTTLVASAMAMHVEIARRADSASDIGLHLSIGERLSDLLPLDASAEMFRARWHLVAGTVMFSLPRPADARRHLEIARALRPDDPAILLALGSVHETEALTVVRSKTSGERTDEQLREIVELYRSAASMAPDLHEARLRLARSHQLLGDLESAEREIARVSGRTSDDHLRYLTLLIEGSIAEAGGHWDRAIARYTQARALCRGCHSATLALSQAFARTGRRVVAHELVERLVTEEVWPPRADPWWVYLQGQWHSVDRLLDQLRREVPK